MIPSASIGTRAPVASEASMSFADRLTRAAAAARMLARVTSPEDAHSMSVLVDATDIADAMVLLTHPASQVTATDAQPEAGVRCLVRVLPHFACMPELATALRNAYPEGWRALGAALFSRSFLEQLDPHAVEAALRSTAPRDLAMALQNTNSEMTGTILQTLTDAAGEAVAAALDELDSVPLTAVESARAAFVQACLEAAFRPSGATLGAGG